MSNGFLKFKRKMRAGALLRALLTGVSAGVIVFAALWIIAKLTTAAQPDLITYGLMGGGVALVLTGILLAITMPTDRRVAKKLDNKLQLNEKVQTMVAFRGEDNDMVQLQRENADSILQQIPAKKMRSKTAWLVLIAPVVACVCLAGAIVVNAQQVENKPPVVENTWTFFQTYRVGLQEIIAYVKESPMDQAPKDATVAQLESLLQFFEKNPTIKESLMKEKVVETITNIHKVVKDNSSYHALVEAMNRTTSEAVKHLAVGIRSLDGNSVAERIEAAKKSFENAGKADNAKLISESVDQALTESEISAEDPFYVTLKAFGDEMAAVTDETTDEDLDAIFARAEEGLKEAVVQPKVNEEVEAEAINRLMELFGISKEQIPEDVLQDFNDGAISGNPSDNEEEEENDSVVGGIGEGENKFGSDDTIYDPYSQTWVSYGEVLARYNSIMMEYTTSDAAPEEIQRLLTYYYTVLSDATKKD